MHNSRSERKLRIAAIGLRGVPSRYSGLETSAESLYRNLAQRGHEITVYCRSRFLECKEEKYHGIQLLRLPSLNFKSTDTLSHIGISLAHALTRGDYDVLHMHALAPGLFAPVRRMSSTPMVATIQGLDWKRAKWRGSGSKVLRQAERSIARHADELIVVSRDLQEHFQREYLRRVDYIPNGVDRLAEQSELDPESLQDVGLEAGRYVLYVGRLVPEKRVEDLITAFRQVPGRSRLVIVGEGRYTNGYVSHLQRLAAADGRIVFTGPLRGKTLATVFSNAAAFVQPSELEGMPMALMECMEYGVTAVVSDIPPHRELLGAIGGYDLFFPPGDVDRLSANIARVVSATDHFRQQARAVQQHVRSHYAWPQIAQRTEEVYLRAIRSTRRPTNTEQSGKEARTDPPRRPRFRRTPLSSARAARLRQRRGKRTSGPTVLSKKIQNVHVVSSAIAPDSASSAVTVVVPCCNERQSLPTLFERLVELECDLADRYDVQVLFIDDGSSDGTWPALCEGSIDRPNWSVVRHGTNQGVAAAIMAGIRAAETETVCSIDADCTYEPSLLAEMIPLLTEGVDLVTASPYHPQGSVDGVVGWRVVLSKCCSWAYRTVLRNKLHTYTSCFRVYRRSTIVPLALRASGFVGIAEMVVRLDAIGSKITEYPATLSSRTNGTSKLRVVPTALAHVKLLASATCSRSRKTERIVNDTHRTSQHLTDITT